MWADGAESPGLLLLSGPCCPVGPVAPASCGAPGPLPREGPEWTVRMKRSLIMHSQGQL